MAYFCLSLSTASVLAGARIPIDTQQEGRNGGISHRVWQDPGLPFAYCTGAAPLCSIHTAPHGANDRSITCIHTYTHHCAKLGISLQELKRQELDDGFVGKPKRPRVIVLSPTRELTEQIAGVARQLSHHAKLRTVALSTGVKYAPLALFGFKLTLTRR